MGCCGVYNEGFSFLCDCFIGKIEVDFDILCCLFILICVLYCWVMI